MSLTTAPTECPQCGGGLYDNRSGKRNPKAPDFRCKDRDGCGWRDWMKKADTAGSGSAGGSRAAAAATFASWWEVAATVQKATEIVERALPSYPDEAKARVVAAVLTVADRNGLAVKKSKAAAAPPPPPPPPPPPDDDDDLPF